MPDQPYNLAMVTLDADPRVNFYSNLPGAPPYKVPVGAAVEVTFEEVAPAHPRVAGRRLDQSANAARGQEMCPA
jgi:uncharacterized OB-fold protein